MDTPYTIIKEFKANHTKELEGAVRQIKGVYQNTCPEPYRGDDHFYDQIKDVSEHTLMILKIPKQIKVQLKNEYIYEFEGFIEQHIPNKETKIVLRFKVLRVLKESSPFIDKIQEGRSEILTQRYSEEKKDVDEILKKLLESGRKPKIALISGQKSYTNKDIYKALEDRRSSYAPNELNVNLSNPTEIINKLKELDRKTGNDKFDIIALYRGGETALDVLNNLNLAKAVLDLETPFVIAVGHAIHHPFIEEIADKFFPTPTALGYYLKITADKAANNIRQKTKFIELEKRYKSEIADLTERLKESNTSFTSFGTLIRQINSMRDEIALFKEFLGEMFTTSPSHISRNEMPNKMDAFQSSRNRVVNFTFGIVLGLAFGLVTPYLYNKFISHPVAKQVIENTLDANRNTSNTNANASDVSNSNFKSSPDKKRNR